MSGQTLMLVSAILVPCLILFFTVRIDLIIWDKGRGKRDARWKKRA